VQLHMTIEDHDDSGQAQQEEGYELVNVVLAQGGALPDYQAYLDGCPTLMAFRLEKYLKGLNHCLIASRSILMRE
jgi:hypothetical protein